MLCGKKNGMLGPHQGLPSFPKACTCLWGALLALPKAQDGHRPLLFLNILSLGWLCLRISKAFWSSFLAKTVTSIQHHKVSETDHGHLCGPLTIDMWQELHVLRNNRGNLKLTQVNTQVWLWRPTCCWIMAKPTPPSFPPGSAELFEGCTVLGWPWLWAC